VKDMEAKVDLSENAMHIVVDGQITKVTPKDFGTDEIIWKDGKVQDVIRSQRLRLNRQEEI